MVFLWGAEIGESGKTRQGDLVFSARGGVVSGKIRREWEEEHVLCSWFLVNESLCSTIFLKGMSAANSLNQEQGTLIKGCPLRFGAFS